MLITAYNADTGVATLSKPLPVAVAQGPRRLGVVRFAPFGSLRRADGSPDPTTEATLRGWLDYVRAVSRSAQTALGTTDAADAGFDVEVWNELTFGSAFLDARSYYAPKPAGADDAQRGWWPLEEITARTAALVKDPASYMPGVRVGNGFDSQRPWGAGSTEPPGVDAICKHPYPPRQRYPDDVPDQQPLDALGRSDGARAKPAWAPRMTAFFPEYPLTALQTEHLIRDVSPIATELFRMRHGRETHPSGGAPLEMWVTEVNVSPVEAEPGITADRAMRVKAKAALRTFTAFNHKGIARVYLYAAKERDVGLGLLGEAFFARGAAAPPVSRVLAAVGRMMTWARARSGTIGPPRRLTVERVEEPDEHAIFEGDGTPAHPALHHRDVLAVFPYQASAATFVVPYYVMTRDVLADMPEETFRVTIGGLAAARLRVEAYDRSRAARSPRASSPAPPRPRRSSFSPRTRRDSLVSSRAAESGSGLSRRLQAWKAERSSPARTRLCLLFHLPRPLSCYVLLWRWLQPFGFEPDSPGREEVPTLFGLLLGRL